MRVQHAVQALPGLALAGSGYRGVGISDCVRSGEPAAEGTRAGAVVGGRRDSG